MQHPSNFPRYDCQRVTRDSANKEIAIGFPLPLFAQ